MTKLQVNKVKPKKGTTSAPQWVTEAYLRLSKRAHLSKITIPVCIYKYGHPNAEGYLFSGRVCLSTYAVEHCTRDDIKALLSHEVGHQTRAMQASNFTSSLIHMLVTLLIICVPMKLIFQYSLVSRIALGAISIKSSVVFWLIWAVVLFIIMASVNLYSKRQIEYRADRYGAKLYKATAMIRVLSKIGRYDKSEHRAIVQMTDDMKLVPWAYCKCLLKLLEFDFNYYGWGTYPSFKERADKIRCKIRSSKWL